MMRKLLMIFLIISIVPLVINAQTTVKIGASTIYKYRITKEHEITLFSWELKFEWPVHKDFGLGLGFRKETTWGYDGYYISLYPIQKLQLSKRCFIAFCVGAEYGIPSSKYNSYQISSHKWVYLVQNIPIPGDFVKGNTGTIYPFGAVSFGIKIWKGLSIEAGLKTQIMKFGVKSYIEDKKNWKSIPSFFIQAGIKLPSKKHK